MSRLIELDVAAPWEPPAPPPRAPRLPRWLAVPLVLLAVLGLVGGAAPGRTFRAVFTLDGLVLDLLSHGDTLFLARDADSAGTLVEAYRFPGGVRLWSRGFAHGAGLVQARGQRLTVAESREEQAGLVLLGLEAATGKVVWRQAGYERIATTDAVVLGTPPTTHRGVIRGMVAFATDDGVVRWSDELPPGTTAGNPVDIRFEPAPRSGIEVFMPDGTVQVRDIDSGELRWNVRIDFREPAENVLVVDDVAIVYPKWQGGLAQPPQAYDLRTGRLLWLAGPGMRLGPCANTLCDLAATGTAALDPRTGAVRWALPGWHLAGSLDERYLLATAGGPVDAPATPPAALVDAWTGRPVRDLGAWRVVGASKGAAVVRLLDSDGANLIARLDVRTGDRHLVGIESSWMPRLRCRSTEVFVACAQTARVLVWLD